MTKITVIERIYDWIAFMDDDRGDWEAGKTSAEAIGRLVFHNCEKLGIEIEFK